MASSREFLDFVLEQLSELDGISYRAMMGEFIIYYKGKIPGGIYDDRLLVKPVKAAIEDMPEASFELPYDGGSKMLLVTELEDGIKHRFFELRFGAVAGAKKEEAEEIRCTSF